jgi:hypothetical protein
MKTRTSIIVLCVAGVSTVVALRAFGACYTKASNCTIKDITGEYCYARFAYADESYDNVASIYCETGSSIQKCVNSTPDYEGVWFKKGETKYGPTCTAKCTDDIVSSDGNDPNNQVRKATDNACY